MATAEEGGATGKTTTMTNTSSYGGGGGGGGAGGKFRKKPLRKPTTPYDRPPVPLRGNDNGASWLTKVVLDPASRLISYGAHRLFASVFVKRLPPPPPPQKSELNHVSSNGQPEAVPNSQNGAQEPAGGECSHPIISSGRNGISELEQLLQQKTFTRSEIEHLTELLHSRAGEVSRRDDEKRNEETALDFGRSQQFGSNLLEANRRERDGSHGVVSTPISKVLGNSISSPTEVAKAYMGSVPSKLSPSMLGKYSQVNRGDNRVIGNMWVASKPPSMSLTTKTAVSPGSPANGFITARSRGRSAIYNMARSPHLKFGQSQGSGINHNGYAGLSMPSTSLALMENSERSEARSMTLKRRSYVLDDDIGSVGPIRRIRQKSNLLLSGSPRTNGVGIASDAMILSLNQKLPLIGDPEHGPRTVEELNGNSIASTSNAQDSSEPMEVAVRTFKHPEKLTSKEESLKSKLVNGHGKTFKLTPNMLRGQALRSMEDVSSAELMLSVQNDHKFESRSDATSSDAHDSQEQGKVEGNGPVESCVSFDTRYPLINSDPVVSLKASSVRNGASDSIVENGVSQPQYKRAFRMSALEDYVDLDDEDDLPCNGIVSPPLFEGREQPGAHLTNNKPSSAGEVKLVKTTIQQEVKSPSGFVSSISSELKGASSMGERSNGITSPTSDEATVAAQSAALPPSVALFDKPKQSNDPPAVFSFSSKVADKFPSLTPESSSRTPETKSESSSSLLNISAPTVSLVKNVELENGGHMKSLAAEDKIGKSDTIPSASSNGPLVSSAPVGLFTAAANHISTSGPAIFTPSTSVSTVAPSGTGDITPAATSSSSIVGVAATPSIFGGPVFKFGGSSDPPSEVSVASTMIIPTADLKTKALKDSTADSVGTVSQGTSVHSFSFASQPSSNAETAPSVSSLSSSQVFVTPFGFNSSASSSGTGAIVSGNGATSSMFGMNSPAVLDGTSASSTSVAAPSMFGFGLSSSSSSTNAVAPSGGAAPPVFNFGSSSSVSASASTFSTTAVASSGGGGAAPPAFSFGASSSNPASVTNTTSSFTNGSSGVFNFGGSSSASSSGINNSVSSGPTPSNPFGSSWQTPKSSMFGSTPSSASAVTGFAFGASAAAAPSSSPVFPFTTSSASAQPVFGNSSSGFAASPGNNNQMNGEDSMAEDPVQSTTPSVAMFGQPSVAPSPPGFMFGMAAPAQAQAQTQANPFQFGGQQNQVAPQNPAMFQASGSLEFNAGGGSFSLGSGGGDKSGRKFVKVNRSKNRKK